MNSTGVDFYTVYLVENEDPRAKYRFEVKVDFAYKRVKDVIIKGGEFVGFWNGKKWSLSIDDLIDLIDSDITAVYQDARTEHPDAKIKMGLMNFESSGLMLKFQNYCKKQTQSDAQFNSKILFSDHEVVREDYSTYQLPYYPSKGSTESFDALTSVLYAPEEMDKILWGLGALFTGEITKIEKFLYLYGAKGTGKGTMLNIIKKLIGNYWAAIDLQAITGSSEFATADIQEVPVLIDSDSDISKISKEQNLLKLTSHEEVLIRKLYKPAYPVVFKGLLITASNERYKVKNVDSGITRRAIVVEPTSSTVERDVYMKLMSDIEFEIPAIAQKCIDRFNELGASYYDDYVNLEMIAESDPMFEFVYENQAFLRNGVTLKRATDLYKEYLTDLGWSVTGAKKKVKSGLLKYYENYVEDTVIDGVRTRNMFKDFKGYLLEPRQRKIVEQDVYKIELNKEEPGVFDVEGKDWPAQYANEDGFPIKKWDDVTTTLKDIDPSRLHYVRLPLNHIVLDFDIKGPNGEKDLEMNMKKASLYPATYTETSKSGGGIHLHYWYDGDVTKLAHEIEPGVEVKVYSGKAALRRKFIASNDKEITHISSGIPLKEEVNDMYADVEDIVWREKTLRKFIERALQKEHHGATRPEIDFIHKVLSDAVDAGVKYDLSDMQERVYLFAMRSTNQSSYCMSKVGEMVFNTIEDPTEDVYTSNDILPDEKLYFYDIEVYPNLLLVAYKKYGFELPGDYFIEDNKVTINNKYDSSSEWYRENKENFGILFNPSPEVIEHILDKPLVGFNNRGYDNHIMYNAMLGASNIELFNQSQSIVEGSGNDGKFGAAFNISYADVYEFLDIKMSLKKWQIKLGINHDEAEFPWDKPLSEKDWTRVAQYCMNDVSSTEELFKSKYGQDAYTARKILCKLTGMPVMTKTQVLGEKFIFGDDPRPQDKFNWYDLAKEFPGYTFDKFRKPQSLYKGKQPSEGGYVSTKPGVYENVIYIDVDSMHPHSLIAVNYFGPYTPKFKALVDCRMAIKKGNLEEASHQFDEIDMSLSEKLSPYLQDKSQAGGLGHAMKIVINMIYGMTSAPYDNKFKDPRNIDNIVAKRGALFMMELEEQLTNRGVEVVHVKTDSMKLHNYTQEDIDFAFDFANKYGYNFSVECIFDKMALIDKAQLIGLTTDGHWEGVGPTFNEDANPYIYHTLFTEEGASEHDFAVFKSSQKGPIYLGSTYIGKNAEIYASRTGQTAYVARDVNISQQIQSRMLKPTDKFLPKRDYEGKSPMEIDQAKYERISKELDYPVSDVRRIVLDGYPEEIIQKFNSVTGTKGHEWKLWSEYNNKDDVDMLYYQNLIRDAVEDIYKVGDGNIIFKGTKWERV